MSKLSFRFPTAEAVIAAGLWMALAGLAGVALWLHGAALGWQWLVTALTLFVAAVVATFSLRHMRADRDRTGFFVRIAATALAVVTFALSTHLAVFAAAWLASGLVLARLIGHRQAWPEARLAARRARRTFLCGDAAMLGAFAILGTHAGSGDLAAVLAAVPSLPPALAAICAGLLLCAAAARCALPPFSGWLLSSMSAPTPVSALMHAGLVNAGGILLLRFAPVLEAAPTARWGAVGLGFAAALWGLGIALVRPDVKRALAGSTVSQMGFMVMSCGLGAYGAALWHLIAHGLFKAGLFLAAGGAVGAARSRAPVVASPKVVAGAALVSLLGAGIASGAGSSGNDFLPLGLATATGLATVAAVASERIAIVSRLTLLAVLAGLALVHAAGLALAARGIGVAGAPLMSPLAAWSLLAAFLAGWVWQSRLLARAAPLPAPLYVHLLNAGRLPPAPEGNRA